MQPDKKPQPDYKTGMILKAQGIRWAWAIIDCPLSPKTQRRAAEKYLRENL
jgi:hypothetical protein